MKNPHTLISEIAVIVNNGFLNGKGTEQRVLTAVKAILHPQHGRLPYVSAQALRKWLRTTFLNNLSGNKIPSYYDRVIDDFKIAKQIMNLTHADPVKAIEDDVFGYTHPRPNHKKIILKNTQNKRPEVVSLNRIAPLRTSIMYPIPETATITRDEGYVHLQNDTPLPYENEFVNAYYTYSASLELHRIGCYENIADLIEIDPEDAEIYLNEGLITKTKATSNSEHYCLNEPALTQRRLLATNTFLRSLLTLSGGAKEAQYLTDLTPKAMIFTLQKSSNPRFMNIFQQKQGKLYLQPQKLIQVVKQGIQDNDFLTQIYLGIRQGYLINEHELRDKIESEDLEDRIHIDTIKNAMDAFNEELEGFYSESAILTN